MPLSPNEVKTEHIATGAVTTPKVGELQITNSKIADGAIKTEKLATKSVTGSKLADNAVTGSKIRDGTVKSEKIALGAITTAKIGELQVTNSRIADKAVTSDKIGTGQVTRDKIQDGAVTPAKLSFTPPSIARPITPAVSTDEIANGAVTPAKLSAIDAPADGETPTYNQAQAKFEWKAPSAVITRPIAPPITTVEIGDAQVTPAKLSFTPLSRPLTPAIETAEIGDAQVTPAKLSFTPITRPLTPPATPDEMEDRFTLAQNQLLFSNLNNVPVSNTLIDCAPYVPVGTKYAIVVMTHTGISVILRGYDGILYVTRADLTNPLYRLDTDAKDFTNYLNVLIPLDANRKFMTSVYRVGVTTSAEIYLVGYVR